MRTEEQDHVVARIAADLGFPPEVVRESYLAAFAELSADARVLAYLPLFAAKRAIARLRNFNAESATQTHSSILGAVPNRSGSQVAFTSISQDVSSPTGSAQPATAAELA